MTTEDTLDSTSDERDEYERVIGSLKYRIRQLEEEARVQKDYKDSIIESYNGTVTELRAEHAEMAAERDTWKRSCHDYRTKYDEAEAKVTALEAEHAEMAAALRSIRDDDPEWHDAKDTARDALARIQGEAP